jgi:hypothetical protein
MNRWAAEARSTRGSARGTQCAVGWSTKPERKRKQSASEKWLADRAELNRERWARRHPEAARAERRLRKERAELLKRWDHKNDGTPETHQHAERARHHQGSLVDLYRREVIDAEQLAAAAEIAQVAERIAAGVNVKTASLETRVDVTRLGDGTFFEKLSDVRHEAAYTRWRAMLPAPAAVLDMIVGEAVGFTIAARRHGIGNKRAKRLLIEALDLWPRILHDAVRAIGQDDLDFAHARIRRL